MIHIFFPSLFTDGREKGPYLSTDERRTFYEKGLRPAIELLLPLNIQEWPATYDGELFRAKKHSGAVAYQTKMIPAEVVPLLVDYICQELMDNDIEWGDECFILHTIRGTKGASKHSQNEHAAALALVEYLKRAHIPLESIVRDGQWWIDVGLEFSSAGGYCLQWTTTSHFHMVEETLQISGEHASRVTRLGSSKYNRDIVNHLPAISGCRIEPGVRAEGPYAAAYCQLYVSEKALTYNPEKGHHGKTITMSEAMGSIQPTSFTTGLYCVFLSARTNISSNARIEVRVPFQHATTVLQRISPQVIRSSLVAFTRDEWWWVFSASITPSYQ
jgi:hypothetical protein